MMHDVFSVQQNFLVRHVSIYIHLINFIKKKEILKISSTFLRKKIYKFTRIKKFYIV
jgi:hypothetical protein